MNGEEMKYPDFEGWLDDNEKRFFEIDLLPDDGPEHQVNSPFQQRRREQIQLLREMWANCWPGYPPLTRIEAIRLLRACHNSATDVAAFVAHCASYQHRGTEIDNPPWYVLKTINDELNVKQEQNTAGQETAESEQVA